MAVQRGLLGNAVRNVGVPRNGELGADQVDGKAGRRLRKFQPMETGRGRNLKVPDSLYDQMCLYARTSKIKVIDKKGKEYTRSLTISEAFCKAAQSLLGNSGPAKAEAPPDAEKGA